MTAVPDEARMSENVRLVRLMILSGYLSKRRKEECLRLLDELLAYFAEKDSAR